MICPLCGKQGIKVIFAGFPMILCSDEDCACLWGFWSFVPLYICPFNGVFYRYEDNYLKALWRWIREID
jgi:hypothetical protein